MNGSLKIVLGAAAITLAVAGGIYLYRNRHVIAARQTGAAMEKASESIRAQEPVMQHIDVDLGEPVLNVRF